MHLSRETHNLFELLLFIVGGTLRRQYLLQDESAFKISKTLEI